MNSQRAPAAFLDRDGVLNVDVGYAHRSDQIVWIEGAAEAVRRLNRSGFRVFVVTNQAGIARGFYEEADVETLHAWMAAELMARGAWIDDWRFSPYHPEHQVERFAAKAHWRKPEPGMLVDLMQQWAVDQSASFLVGDRETDLAAAQAAGISGHLFTGGRLDDFLETVLASP